MRKLTILLTFLAVILLMTGCQGQKVPSAPGAFTGPVGEAGAALPGWAADAGTAISISPDQFPLSVGTSETITVSFDDDFVWREFFVLELGLMTIQSQGPGGWRQYNLPCTPISGTDWCEGPVSMDIDVDLTHHFAGNNYLIAYTCAWDSAMQAFDCSGNRWKLTTFWINVTEPASTVASVAQAGYTATANVGTFQ